MTTIPIISSAADVPGAVRHAQREVGARWYVARRAEVLGRGDLVPKEWGITAAFGGDWSPPARKDAEKKGQATGGGSFPIKDKADLKRAIQAYGRAKDKAEAKKHIIKRAKALGAVSELPESWGVTASAVAQDRLTRRQKRGKMGRMDSITAAGSDWDGDLHPRDRKGRFIEKMDLISIFSVEGGSIVAARGRAIGNSQSAGGEDYVHVEITDGPSKGKTLKVPVSKVESAPPAKARMDDVDAADKARRDELQDPQFKDRSAEHTTAEDDAKFAHRIAARESGDERKLSDIDKDFYATPEGKAFKAGTGTDGPQPVGGDSDRLVLNGKLYEHDGEKWQYNTKDEKLGPKDAEPEVVGDLDAYRNESLDGAQPSTPGLDTAFEGTAPEVDRAYLNELGVDDAEIDGIIEDLGDDDVDTQAVYNEAVVRRLPDEVSDGQDDLIDEWLGAAFSNFVGDRPLDVEDAADQLARELEYDSDDDEDDEEYGEDGGGSDEALAKLANESAWRPGDPNPDNDNDYALAVLSEADGYQESNIEDDAQDDRLDALMTHLAGNLVKGDGKAAADDADMLREYLVVQGGYADDEDLPNRPGSRDNSGAPSTGAESPYGPAPEGVDPEAWEVANNYSLDGLDPEGEERQLFTSIADSEGVDRDELVRAAGQIGGADEDPAVDAPEDGAVEVEELEDGDFSYDGVPFTRNGPNDWEDYDGEPATPEQNASLEDALRNSPNDYGFEDLDGENGDGGADEDPDNPEPDDGSGPPDVAGITTYLREEGRDVDQFDIQAIADAHPDWNGNQVYEEADAWLDADAYAYDPDWRSGGAEGMAGDDASGSLMDDPDHYADTVRELGSGSLVADPDFGTKINDEARADLEGFRGLLDVDSEDGAWVSGVSAFQFDSLIDAVDTWEEDNEAVDEWTNDKLVAIREYLDRMGIDSGPDGIVRTIETRKQANEMGWSTQEQLLSILNGESLDDQSPHALRNIIDFLQNNPLAENQFGEGEFTPSEIASDISEYLNLDRPGAGEAPEAPGGFDPERYAADLGVDTLETQNSDSLDFHDMSAATIKDALTKAYKDGHDGAEPPEGLLESIAAEHLGRETLETRNSDSLDFADESVAGLSTALRAAHDAPEAPANIEDPDSSGYTPSVQAKIRDRYAAMSDQDLVAEYEFQRGEQQNYAQSGIIDSAQFAKTEFRSDTLRDELDKRGLDNKAARKGEVSTKASPEAESAPESASDVDAGSEAPSGGGDPEAANTVRLMGRSADKASSAIGRDEADARINGVLDDAAQGRIEKAHKDLAKLMTEMKLGGKQRKRYREALDAYAGSQGGESAKVSAGAVADSLRDDNPVKEKLKAKASAASSDSGLGSYKPKPGETVADRQEMEPGETTTLVRTYQPIVDGQPSLYPVEVYQRKDGAVAEYSTQEDGNGWTRQLTPWVYPAGAKPDPANDPVQVQAFVDSPAFQNLSDNAKADYLKGLSDDVRGKIRMPEAKPIPGPTVWSKSAGEDVDVTALSDVDFNGLYNQVVTTNTTGWGPGAINSHKRDVEVLRTERSRRDEATRKAEAARPKTDKELLAQVDQMLAEDGDYGVGATALADWRRDSIIDDLRSGDKYITVKGGVEHTVTREQALAMLRAVGVDTTDLGKA